MFQYENKSLIILLETNISLDKWLLLIQKALKWDLSCHLQVIQQSKHFT